MDVQSAISQRYAQLSESITRGNHDAENAILGPHFADRAKVKLDSFEYNPLTVVVQKITPTGSALVVEAEYVGVHGHNATTVDRWIQVDGNWVLVSRGSTP